MTEIQSNTTCFKQILAEIKQRHPVKDIFYSEHIGNWTLQMSDGDSEEFETFERVLNEIALKKIERTIKGLNLPIEDTDDGKQYRGFLAADKRWAIDHE